MRERCQAKDGSTVPLTASTAAAIANNAAGTLLFVTPIVPIPSDNSASRKKGKDREKEKEKEKIRKGRTTPPPLPCPSIKEVLSSLLQSGMALGIHVEEEMAVIRLTLAAVDRWNTQTCTALLSLDFQHIAPVTELYRGIVDWETPHTDRESSREVHTGSPPFSCLHGISRPISSSDSGVTPSGLGDGVDSNTHIATHTDTAYEALTNERISEPIRASERSGNCSSSSATKIEESLWSRVTHFNSLIQRLAAEASDLGIRTNTNININSAVTERNNNSNNVNNNNNNINNSSGGIVDDSPISSTSFTTSTSASSTFEQLQLCISAVRWMEAARDLLLYPTHNNTHASYSLSTSTLHSNSISSPNASTVTVTDSAEFGNAGEKKKIQKKHKNDVSVNTNNADPTNAPNLGSPEFSSPQPDTPTWSNCPR